MEKKRSVGVTAVGTMLILWGTCVLCSSLLPIFLNKLPILWTLADLPTHLKLLISALGLVYAILGFNILSLKSWARRTIVFLSSIIWVPIALFVVSPFLIMFLDAMEGLEVVNPLRQDAFGFVWFLALGAALVICFSPLLIALIFLTRPKVKKQFK